LTKTPNKSDEELAAAVEQPPACLASSTNLGVVDFYPCASGKEGAAAYLMRKLGVPAGRCALLCDDDNDLQLAAIVGKAFLPSIGAVSYLHTRGVAGSSAEGMQDGQGSAAVAAAAVGDRIQRCTVRHGSLLAGKC
jgi:3-deoxy-D-manno-octulosonate 8-phosphate phosphatase KdsC-like HAD superfamily phosphatase